MKPSEILLGFLRIPIDFLMAVIGFLLAYQLRWKTDLIPFIQLPITREIFPPFREYVSMSIIGSIILIIVFAIYRLYSLKTTISFAKEFRQIFTASSIWLMLVIFYYF